MSIGKNTRHDSGVTHVTGKSTFVDDRPILPNELFVDFVGAPVAAGELLSIDFKEALNIPGVVDVYTYKDLAINKWGSIVHDQPFLIEKEIGYIDEPVCIVAAESREALLMAKKSIKINVKEKKPVFTIDEAKKTGQPLYKATPFVKGDVNKVLYDSEYKLSGQFICGGQEHFYLESHATVVYPQDNGTLEIHSSSQHPSETQRLIAEVTGLPFHKSVCVVKRMGGGFGGKESQAAHFGSFAAIAAVKTGRPARICLTKDDDMMSSGKRHPFQNDYEVGFNKDGVITALKCNINANAGAYTDLSPSILERAMFHIDNGYYLPIYQIEGYCYKTNMHSNTAFRGFGGPQGAMTIESIMDDIAKHLQLDPLVVRERNLYAGDCNTTPYGQVVENNFMPKLFKEIRESAEYEKRRKEIDDFNSAYNGRVRGMSIASTKFGIAFTAKFLNQGNAQVNLQLDGTAQVSTGATEMGQGVNTKIAQTVAHAFGIDFDDVQIMPTSTEKNHNTSATAASSGSDINCAAALAACEKIKFRLSFLANEIEAGKEFGDIAECEVDYDCVLPLYKYEAGKVINSVTGFELKLGDLISQAYLNRLSLGEYSHFKTDKLGFDKSTGTGRPFNYFTMGVAISEVEVDEFTGAMKVLRSDILMDLGRRINPGIDRGQVTGAFIQGMGWVTTEKLFYSENGKLLSHSPTTYKIPNIQDTPRVFNVNFIENETNTVNVHRSKAVGEPPFLLGISVWTAIKNAMSYRKKSLVEITSPATAEEILMSLMNE